MQHVNPLTTDGTVWRHQTLAACYQLAQSVLKIGFALARWDRRVSAWTWQLPWRAIEEPWSALAGPFLALLAQTGSGTTPLPL